MKTAFVAENACSGATEEFHQWTIAMLDKIVNKIELVDGIITSLT